MGKGISDIKDRNLEMTQREERDLSIKKRALQELSDFISKSFIRIIGILEKEDREKGTESLFKE